MKNQELRNKILLHREFLDLCFGNRFMVDLTNSIFPPKKFKASSVKSFWKDFISSTDLTQGKVLDFYIHIPYCLDKCHYCHYRSQKLEKGSCLDAYLDNLISYFRYFKNVFEKVTFTSLYIGGGTPNILNERQMNNLLSQLFTLFKFDPEGEKTFEGDPCCSSIYKLKLLKKYGFNRVSFGVQSFNKKALKYANRADQTDKIVRRAVSDAEKAGFSCVNIDIILGLYGEEGDLFVDSFKKALKLKPYSISVYPLQINNRYLKMFFASDRKKFFKYRKRIISSVISKILKIAEMEQYSCPSYSSLYLPMTNSTALTFFNNKNTSPFKKSYILDDFDKNVSCFGVGEYSISKINDRNFSYQMINPLHSNPSDYIYEGVFLNKKNQMAEYIIRIFSFRKFISRAGFQKFFDVDILNKFKNSLKDMEKMKVISIEEDRICFLPKEDYERKMYSLFFFDTDDIKLQVEKQKRAIEKRKDLNHNGIVFQGGRAMEREKIKKTVIFLGYACNNKCVFCINWDKREIPSGSLSEVKNEMVAAKMRGTTYLEFVGGEPATSPNILELIKFAKELKFRTIMTATNGRMYFYSDFARKMFEAGLNSLVFSIHGHTSKLHDSLTQVPGSFQQLKKGLENVKKLIKELDLDVSLGSNTCIVKQNYKQLPQIGEYIRSLGINNSEFIFVDPSYGAAFRKFDELVPKISQAVPYIRQCLDIGKKNHIIHWHVRYVPLCYFQDYLNQISELQEVAIFQTEHVAPDFYNLDTEKSRKTIARAKTSRCVGCRLFDNCEGIWREYLKYYGDKELIKIK